MGCLVGAGRYPEYKDSGVPWLGDIPAHWVVKPLKHWVKINAHVLPETTSPDHKFCYIDIGSVGTGVLVRRPQTLVFESAPSRARRVLQQGDTIISTVRTYLKAIYFVEGKATDLVASTGFAVLTPRADTHPKFISFLVRSDHFTDRVTANSVGTAYPAIAETRLGAFHVAVPPLTEQIAIARFLDHVDRRIRRYIRAQRKLIALLEEQKQAIIQRAVTRGLDLAVHLKPSGVEWLGEIPEHWEVRRSRYIYREVDERSADGDEVHLSMSQRLGLVPSSMIEEHRLMSESYAGAKICRAGDLVLNRLKAHLGVFALAPERGVVSPDYTVFRADGSVCARYYELVYRSPACRVELRKRAKGIVQGFWRLYTDDFYQIYVPVPPRNEQEAILAYLDDSLRTIHLAVERHSRQIDLIREYRTRLIADVVTGKLDVRQAAADLPDEAEEWEEPGEVAETDEEKMMAEQGQEEEE